IELQQRFAARAYDKAPALRGGGPFGGDRTGERIGGGELAPARPVDADEIGIAEIACRRRAIGFASRPQVASGEAAEDRGGSGVRTFALERVEDLLHRIHWLLASRLSRLNRPASSPRARSGPGARARH